MFYERLVAICAEKGTNPTALCDAIGLAQSAATRWKQGSVPRDTTMRKIADHLGTTASYLKGDPETPDENKNDPPIISESEEKLLELFREVPEADRYMVIQMVEAALAAKRRERYMEEELGISYIRNPDPRYVVRKDAGKKLAELEKVGKK